MKVVVTSASRNITLCCIIIVTERTGKTSGTLKIEEKSCWNYFFDLVAGIVEEVDLKKALSYFKSVLLAFD